MPSTRPTAIEELQGRIETLDDRIRRCLKRAGELQNAARFENDDAAELALLRTQYKRILETVG